MQIEFDPGKRNKVLAERSLDFALANEIGAGKHLTNEDLREDYAEQRFQTAGWLDARIVIIVWTPRGAARRIISMRKANEREIAKLRPSLD